MTEQGEEEVAEEVEEKPGFGAASHFMPLPNTVVGSHCTWQLRLNTVPARIPGQQNNSAMSLQPTHDLSTGWWSIWRTTLLVYFSVKIE